MNDLKIDVGRLKRPGDTEHVQLRWQPDASLFQGEQILFLEALDVEANVARVRHGYAAEVRVDGIIQLKCHRCLEPFQRPVHLAYREDFVEAGMEIDVDGGERSIEEGRIDLEPGFWENFLLDLPIKRLCEAECKGLCTQCGNNLNTERCDCVQEDIDPRFMALAALRGKLQAEGNVREGDFHGKP